MKNIKIILIDTSYPINSRNQRIVESLSGLVGKSNIKIITWDRKGDGSLEILENYSVFSRNAPLGDKKAKLKLLFQFKKYIKNIINSYNPNIIIASHWDSLLIAASLKKNKQILIYENLDMPCGGFLIRKIISIIERYSLRKADAISYASRFYMPFYSFFKGKHILLENKLPQSALSENSDSDMMEGHLKVMFNGSIRYPETMLNLFEAIGNNNNIELLIFGYPAGKDGEDILKKAENYKNIHYKGSYRYSEVPLLYSNVDVVWAVYPSNDFNVKYAISNKFHESLAFNVPGIFACDTKLGELVSLKKIGFVVYPYSIDLIKELFENLINNKKNLLESTKSNLKLERKNCCVDWESEFKDFKDYIKEQLS